MTMFKHKLESICPVCNDMQKGGVIIFDNSIYYLNCEGCDAQYIVKQTDHKCHANGTVETRQVYSSHLIDDDDIDPEKKEIKPICLHCECDCSFEWIHGIGEKLAYLVCYDCGVGYHGETLLDCYERMLDAIKEE